MYHLRTVDLVDTNGGRPTTSFRLIFQCAKRQRRAWGALVSTSTDLSIQLGARTKRHKMDRWDHTLKPFSAACTVQSLSVGVGKPRGVSEHFFRCEMVQKAEEQQGVCSSIH